MSNHLGLRSPGCGLCAIVGLFLALTACGGSSSSSTKESSTPQNPVGPNLMQISSDPFTVATAQHATEVEPHMISNGNTLVAAFQVGRIPGNVGGSTDIGWATSTDGGATWTHRSLPGLTTGEGSGLYDTASDPAVAYDAKHDTWMIASLPIGPGAPAVALSRSVDGGLTWQNPESVDPTAISSDKNWIVCDSWSQSPYYGNCYIEWDDTSNGNQILMSTSSDGGVSWSIAVPTMNGATGIGGQPLVQPSGTVIVPIASGDERVIESFHSNDGGISWSAPIRIANVQLYNEHQTTGIRSSPLPSSAIDSSGTVWTVWEDCRFRPSCSTNDLVYSTSTNGVNWSQATRIPIDDISSTVDHFIPGIGIDPATSGSSAHVAVHYYFYSRSNCATNCQLFVGFISSANGGATWNTPSTLTAAPMELSWLPTSQNGLMVGDYIATAFVNGVPHGVFAVAQPTTGTGIFEEAMYTASGLSVMTSGQQLSAAHDKPLHKLTDKIEREAPEKGIVPPTRRPDRKSAK